MAGPLEQDGVSTELEVSYSCLDDLVVALTEDLREGGIFVRTDRAVPVGERVELVLRFPRGGEVVSTIARVSRIVDGQEGPRSPGVELEFLDSTAEQLTTRLPELIRNELTRQSGQDEVPPALILIVDDSESHRNALTQAVEAAGHGAIAATDGVQALRIAMKEAPDLILSDVHMPSMDGWSFLRIVRSRPSLSHVPFVFLTDLSSDQDRLNGYKLGVDDYIPKPFVAEEVIARAQRLLARSQSDSRRTVAKKALRGELQHVALASLLSFVEMERRTGMVLVVREQAMACLHLKEGNVVRVDLSPPKNDLAGVDRLFHVLDWTQGRFELTAAEVSAEDRIGMPTSFAILEHARRRDESEGTS